MQPPKEQPALHVSADLFRQHKLRIEKVRRIAADLKSGNRQRLEELRAMEATSTQRPDLAPQGLVLRKEELVDARSWFEQRLRLTYVSPQGERIDEVVVIFMSEPTGEDGPWLSVPGTDGKQAYAIPAELFDARIASALHGIPVGAEIRMVPNIDGRGAYLGVYSVIIDAR